MGRKVATIESDRVKYTVVLDCHHELLFAKPVPQKGEMIWCLRCNREALIMDTVANYRLECATCSFGRQYGRGRITAERAAVRHRYRHGNHHTVTLYDGLKLVHVFTTHPRQLLLDSKLPDTPPF